MFSFEGRIAAVTGADKGIGKEVARGFIEGGARVVLLSRNAEEGGRAAAELGGRATFIALDVSDETAVARIGGEIERRVGLVDILVNNAGVVALGNVLETDIETWDRVMDVDLRGVFLTTKYLIPHMLRRKKGVIVNVSSEAGISAFKNQVAYNTAKAAVIHFTRSVAVDYAGNHIRANVVCPGTTDTPLVQGLIRGGVNRADMENIRPLNRLGSPKEIADAVLCMASDELGYATGSVLTIDGGYTIQ